MNCKLSKNTQKIGKDIKKLFLDRNKKMEKKTRTNRRFLDKNRRSNRKVSKDRSEIHKIRKRVIFF